MKLLKRMIITACLFFVCAGSGAVFGATQDIAVLVDGKPVSFDGATPFIDNNGRTQVPLRTLAEQMGYGVDWDQKEQKIFVFTTDENGNRAECAEYIIGNSQVTRLEAGGSGFTTEDTLDVFMEKVDALVENDTILMDTTPVINTSRTYIPAKYLAEVFGYHVGWDNASKTVVITTDGSPAVVPEAYAKERQAVLVSRGGSRTGTPQQAAQVPAEAAQEGGFVGMEDGGYYFTQDPIPRGGCVLTCIAMIASNLQDKEVTPTTVYGWNGGTVYYQWSKLDAACGLVNSMRLDVRSCTTEQKMEQIISSLTWHPKTTMLSFVGNGQRHSVVATGYDPATGTLYVSDPRYGQNVPLEQSWTGAKMLPGDNDLQYLTMITAFQ